MKRKFTIDLTLKIIIVLFATLSFAIYVKNCVRLSLAERPFDPTKFNPYNYSNVFNGWINFTYLTYLGTIFSFVYCWADLICFAKKKRNLNDNLMVVVACNELLIFSMYCLYQTILPDSFSLAKISPAVLHRFFVNLVLHVIFPLLCTLSLLFSPNRSSKKINYKAICIGYIIFAAVYFTSVKLVGEFVLPGRWFPYPIFSPDCVWMTMFGGLTNFNYGLALFILIMFWLIMVALMCLFAIGLGYVFEHKEENSRRVKVIKFLILALILIILIVITTSVILHAV